MEQSQNGLFVTLAPGNDLKFIKFWKRERDREGESEREVTIPRKIMKIDLILCLSSRKGSEASERREGEIELVAYFVRMK